MAGDAITRDTLLRGRVTLLQPARGFRSSLDPVLLSGFLPPPFGRFLDIGCGTGALSFLLLARDPEAHGVGLELQPRLAALTREALTLNGCQGRLTVEVGDARHSSLPAGSFDLVVTNPPFQALGHGELPPDPERSIAHHEVALTLRDWLAVTARAVREEGRVGVVFPASRTAELLAGLVESDLQPLRVRAVHPRLGTPATRVLVEAQRRTRLRALTWEPPLYLHDGSGYSSEVRRWLGEGDALTGVTR